MNDLEPWENSLSKFLKDWKYQEITVGVLVCGSFITGNPTKQSDVDVHIILSSDTSFRERGNKIIDGVLIEYFANPPSQIERYFQDDYEDYSRMSMVQFLTGRIISDPLGVIQQLKDQAQKWFIRPFPKLDENKISLMKYSLWDMRDNLIALNSVQSPSFLHAYHQYLHNVIDNYRKYLGYDVIKPDKTFEIFSSEDVRRKYIMPPFPDLEFTQLIIQTFKEASNTERLYTFSLIIDHIFDQWKSYTIDGWEFQSPLS